MYNSFINQQHNNIEYFIPTYINLISLYNIPLLYSVTVLVKEIK